MVEPLICPTCHEPTPHGGIVCPRDGTVLVSASADPLIGQTLGDYRITERLGLGGMGVVYAGVQPVIGKRVAIKCLHWHYSRDPEQVRRLVNEARAVNAIGHRSIIDIFGYGALPDGRQYLVMELLEGESLDALLARSGGRMPVAEAVALVEELCDVLQAAHEAGVIHRDLKPSNVFLVKQVHGPLYPKLLDFGLAKLKQSPQGATAQSRAAGTPDYAAPEQILGEDVDARSDLYALGVMFFQILVGRPPFEAPSLVQLLHKHLHTPAPRASRVRKEVPQALDELIFWLMQKKPDERPASAAVVRAQLTKASPASRPGRATPRRAAVLGGGVLALALVSLAAWQLRPRPAPTPPAPLDETQRLSAEVAAVRALLPAHLLGPDGAAAKLDLALERYGNAAALIPLRGELVTALKARAESELGKRAWAEAAGLLKKVTTLTPQDEDAVGKLARARRGELADRSGMVQVGAFWIDRYEWPNRRGAMPATSIDWAQAAKRCAEVQKRLCTEAEWEAACTGDAASRWPYGKRYLRGVCQTQQRALSPAGSHARCATFAGVLDLSGNAAEWTASEVRPGAPQRVVRGGAFTQEGAKVSCSARDYFLPGQGGAKHLGFRCCL